MLRETFRDYLEEIGSPSRRAAMIDALAAADLVTEAGRGLALENVPSISGGLVPMRTPGRLVRPDAQREVVSLGFRLHRREQQHISY